MIPRSRLSSRLLLACTCLVPVLLVGARLRGDTPGAPAPASKPDAAPAQPVPDPAAARPPPSAHAPPAAAPAAPAAESKPTPKPERDDAASMLKLGDSLTARADYSAAEIAYRQVMNSDHASDQDVKSALLGLAQMHRRQGALTKAAAIYERFLKEFPGDERSPDALLELGRTLRSLGVYKSAIARFYNVLNATLKLPGEGLERYQLLAKTAQFEIAETHFQAGEFAEANKFYTRLRLLDLAPVDRARAHFKASYALRLQGNTEGAATALRAFIDQWPDDENVPEARYLLAISLRELNRPQEAFAATLDLLRAEKARVAADPKRWAYWQRRTGNHLANDFFETGDTLNASTLYANLLELAPEPAWRLPLTYQLALCYDRLGDAEKAREAYRTVVEGAGKDGAAEGSELARMAAWRIEHLGWRDSTARKISSLYDPGLGQSAPLAAASPATAAPAVKPPSNAPHAAATP